MCALQRPLTYDDLFAMPDDGLRRELIGGELIVNPAPRRSHQAVSIRLTSIFLKFLEATGTGWVFTHPVDLDIGPHDMVQPDLIVIEQSRLGIYLPEGRIIEPPDIVVEILSPSTQRVDRVGKMALYARFGVPEYWIADPEERVLVVSSLEGRVYMPVAAEADGSIRSRRFAGLRIDPADVFRGLDWEETLSEGIR